MFDLGRNCIRFYIIIPVFNTEKYIRKCVESIINQTFDAYDIVLVDDGSTDNAGKICDEYAHNNEHIHVVHKVNEGQLSARQTGIEYIKNDFSLEKAFFIFVDSDDYLQINALETVAQTVSQYDCDMVIYGMQRVCEGKVINEEGLTSFQGIITDKRELYRKTLLSFEYNSLCRKAIKCDLLQIFDYNDFYHVRRGEDLIQSVPVYGKCQKAVFINDVLYNYTVNPNSITNSITYETYFVDSSARAIVWKFLESENVFTHQDKKEFIDHCFRFLRNELLMIGAFDVTSKKIVALFKQIKQDSFFSMIINYAENDCLLSWLRKDKFYQIIIYAKIRRRLVKLYRVIKKYWENRLRGFYQLRRVKKGH